VLLDAVVESDAEVVDDTPRASVVAVVASVAEAVAVS
jgi:hypothetical protein